ncbi:MAG: Rad52/Rad22 family DNA repair protein [Bryobacteraceae bacterium]
MQANTATAGTADAPSSAATLQYTPAPQKYTDEQVRQLEVALENPFESSEIKWRVTNTTSDRRRGQVIAYADPRAYTDRLNALFTVRGWTREYAVQVIQNFERKDRGNGEGTISGKIVVTCRLTIDGLGSHSGLGEEWADNENAGTSAEAQAFKRACSCFGLGRYLYDLGGNWVDLDDRKQPLSRPQLPDWALPKRKHGVTAGQNGDGHSGANGHRRHGGVDPANLPTLKARVKSLCEQVGFGLSRSVTQAVTAANNSEEISDVAVLSALATKLEDTRRGVERLRAATSVVGQASFSRLCQEMNLAGDCVDDIPDRRVLRQLIEALEPMTGVQPQHVNGAGQARRTAVNGHAAPGITSGRCNGRSSATAKAPDAEDVKVLGTARANLVREAQRVGKLRNMKVSDVIDRAAKGAFRFAGLRRLTLDSLPTLEAAIDVLRQVEQ